MEDSLLSLLVVARDQMPARARKEIVDAENVGFYHCYSRCVRRAFLCGDDEYSGKNYDHRKDWVEKRLAFLAALMAVDLIATTVMDNHYHLVLRIRPELVQQWTDHEVARRWLSLCPGTRKETALPMTLTTETIDQLVADQEKLAEVRKRLSDLSWFMKFLNEYIARKANAEDDVTGHFFEGRFKSTQLLDDFAILVAVVYVELNPIRAKVAETPETSRHASVYRRIQARQAQSAAAAAQRSGSRQDLSKLSAAAAWLAPVQLGTDPPDGPQAERGRRASDRGFLEMSLDQLLSLIDWSGRQLRADKRGAVPASLDPILDRIDVDVDFWLTTVQSFRTIYRSAAGKAASLVKHAQETGQRWYRGVGAASKAT